MTFKGLFSAFFTGKTPFTYLYIFLVPFVNWSFAHVPTVPLPDHGNWSPMSIVTGLILVVRDFVQREIGHKVFIPLLIGVVISFQMAPANIAIASASAFLVSEFLDWALYTYLKMPLSKRIFISAGFSEPVDSTVFLLLASASIPGLFNIYSVGSSILSKLLGCVVVYFLLRAREQRANALS